MRYNIQCITSRFIDANCYIIRKDNCNIIIDPCISVKELLKYGIKEVSAILVTHGHVDHIIFIEEVSKYYNCEVYFSKNCKEKQVILFQHLFDYFYSLQRKKCCVELSFEVQQNLFQKKKQTLYYRQNFH